MMELIHGDCLEIMRQIPDGSVDLVLADPPYGTTQCKWDSVIDLESMWVQLKRIVTPNAAIVLCCGQPFTSVLIASNLRMFKYCWIWEKERPSNFFQAKYAPLNNTEDIAVFGHGGTNNGSKTPMTYYPQGVRDSEATRLSSTTGGKVGAVHGNASWTKGKFYAQDGEGYPMKRIKFGHDKPTVHPTQKPVALMEYMLHTYSREGDLVLDFCMGSGTTAVACRNLGRSFVGIDSDQKWVELARERVETA